MSGYLARIALISGTEEATSPTETACNQMESGGVRENGWGSHPSLSVKPARYSRRFAIRQIK